MKIGWMTVDWYVHPETSIKTPESSGFYRCFLPYEGLARQGHITTIGRSLKATRFGWALVNPITRKTSVPDVLIIQRWMDAEGAYAVRWAQKRGQLVLADIDDWMFGLHHDNIAHVQMQTALAKQATTTGLEFYAELLKAVDGVICSTPFLAEKVRKHFNRNVAVVRNAIDLTRWPDPPQHGNRPGWVGAVHWRSHDLEQLKGIIGPILDHHEVPFAFVGFDGYDGSGPEWVDAMKPLYERIGVKPHQISFTLGCGPLEYPERLRTSDIGVGLVPLNDHPFNYAKSTVKGMEYAAAGIPFVAQDMPEYRWMYETYGIGLLAKRPRNWITLIDRLVHDADYRNKIARENRLKIESFDIAYRGSDWIEAITRLGQRPCNETSRRVMLHAT